MIQSFIFIIILKQWKQLVIFFTILTCTLLLIWAAYSSLNQSFKIPVAVQDQDQSQASHTLIQSIEKNDFVKVEKLDQEAIYLDESVSKKEAVAAMHIPKDYSDKLKNNQLKLALTLYARDDFIGDITFEMISRSLYEQQIPYIVKKHLDDDGQEMSLEKVSDTLNQHTPKSAIVHHVVNTNSETSISISLVFGIILFVSSVQIVLHQRLKQNGPLTRLFIFQYSKLILFTTYILIHTLILMLVLGITTFIFQQQLSFTFFAKSLVIIIVYELGVSWLLFKINTLSHRLFMAVIFALLMAVLYIFIQL